jgi:uncharacterized membrane protein
VRLPFTNRDQAVQGNFDKLAGRLDFENMRCGTGSITFTASTDSANTVVTHGLGRAPKAVLVSVKDAPTFLTFPKLNAGTWTATTFTVNGRLEAAGSLTVGFSWVAYA